MWNIWWRVEEPVSVLLKKFEDNFSFEIELEKKKNFYNFFGKFPDQEFELFKKIRKG